MLPRGIRNNNPLNIRRGKDQWKGLRAQQTDASFCQFESLEYGWRAAFYLLTRTYYHKYRLYTIRKIISKWAPPNENLTATYIQNVCRLTGIAPDETIGIPSDQPQRWMAVGMAMAIQENGTESLDYFAMLRGWALRLYINKKASPTGSLFFGLYQLDYSSSSSSSQKVSHDESLHGLISGSTSVVLTSSHFDQPVAASKAEAL